MGITIDMVIHADDDLKDWIDWCLDMTIGCHLRTTIPPNKKNIEMGAVTCQALPTGPLAATLMGDIAAEVGWGIALRIQA